MRASTNVGWLQQFQIEWKSPDLTHLPCPRLSDNRVTWRAFLFLSPTPAAARSWQDEDGLPNFILVLHCLPSLFSTF